MTSIRHLVLAAATVLALSSLASAQRPGPPGRGEQQAVPTIEAFVARMMSLDKDGDGQLKSSEVTDARLHALLNRADANKDSVVTKEELTSLYSRESASLNSRPRGFGGPGGPGGLGPGGRRPP